MTEPKDDLRPPAVTPAATEEGEAALPVSVVEERISVATQWQLMWWRFKKHKLAMASSVIVILFYLVVCSCGISWRIPTRWPRGPALRSCPRRRIQWLDNDASIPSCTACPGGGIPSPSNAVYTPDPEKKLPDPASSPGVQVPPSGSPPRSHLVGRRGTPQAEETLFLLGTDGRGEGSLVAPHVRERSLPHHRAGGRVPGAFWAVSGGISASTGAHRACRMPPRD